MKRNMKMSINSIGTISKFILVSAILSALTVTPFWSYPEKAFAGQTDLSISNVRVNKTTLIAGAEVMIFYRLTKNAKVSIFIYDPDYRVVRRLLYRLNRPAGTNTIVWDGRDDSGATVPDEAYIFSIVAEGDNGHKAVYDPTAHSGGEMLDGMIERIERFSGNYIIHYSVAAPSRISIRAGVHKGPMLKTILDWKPLPPGDYTETWDGLDETGRIRIMEAPGNIVYLRGFLLPENTIIVQGSGVAYSGYHPGSELKTAENLKVISRETIRRSALKRRSRGISPEYLFPRALNSAPRFFVYKAQNMASKSVSSATSGSGKIPLAEETITDVSGKLDLTVEVAPESMQIFNEYRYEIVVFVDNKRFDEEETAYSPYTYSLDTSKLAKGEHSVTINMISFTGQVRAYSFMIYVNN